MAQPTDWKRTLSLALGAAGVVHGLRRGGITGLLEVAASVWALKQSLPGLQLDGQASPARSARDIPAERLPDADLGVPGGAYNVRPEPIIGDAAGMGPVPAEGLPRP